MANSKKTKSTKAETSIQLTSYAEVNRIHRGALSALKGSVVVTSTLAGEGVTLLAQLMAQRNAENGHKTLLVDLNMRNTNLSDSLGVEHATWNLAGRDLTEGLGGLVQAVKGTNNLFFLPVPLDNASIEFLRDGANAAQFFKVLENDFEHIIVDTTPVGLLNRYNIDPVVLSAAAQRSILVMMAGYTPRSKVLKAIKQLRESGANVEGLVVNDKENPSLKSQLFAFADFFNPIAPGFTAWMRGKIIKAESLD